MKLKDALEDAVADTTVDVPALVREARRGGLANRRRRRALTSVGIVAAAALVGGAAWVTLPGGGADTAREPSFVGAPVEAPAGLSGRTGPATGRGVAAALVASVDEVTQRAGMFADFRGEAGDEPMAEFLFTTDDAPPGIVQLDVQPLAGPIGDYLGPPPYTCDQSSMRDCAVTVLAGGDTLRTYVDRISGSNPGYERNVAEVISQARGLRLVLGAATTSRSEKHVVRAEPPLTIDQLAQVAAQPWWSLDTLPVEYLDQGDGLSPYTPMCTEQPEGDHTITMCG